jgi:hypothetical protein
MYKSGNKLTLFPMKTPKPIPYTSRNNGTELAFVSFSNKDNVYYYTMQQRYIAKSLHTISKYDYYMFTEYNEIGSPSHQESPYEFKIHAIKTVKDMGYRYVVWCDSVYNMVTDFDIELLEKITNQGVYIQEDGWKCGQWANDRSLEYFKITRDIAMNITGSHASIMCYDFNSELANQVLNKFLECGKNGIFKGKWDNTLKTESQDTRCLGHRHDQTCLELIANELKIEKQPALYGGSYGCIGKYFTIR